MSEAYDSNAIRAMIDAQGATAVIQSMPQRESAIGHDKRDDNFLASVQLALICIWLRSYESAPLGSVG